MLYRIFIFLIGFGFMIIGNIYIISYLNLMTIGYNFIEYVNFIIRSAEFIYTVIGFIIVNLCIFIKGSDKHEIHI